jgi:hypothetical protein
VLICFWSPKGGSGTSVIAAATAAVLAREGPARLADLGGDQPAIFGLASDPEPGLRDWLRIGPEAPTDALDRFTVPAGNGLALLGAGAGDVTAAPEAGAALAVALAADGRPTVADVGRVGPSPDALHGLVEVADAHLVVVRGCYLALRRAVRIELTARASGVVFVDEGNRSLGPRDVANVLGLPVVTTVQTRASTARAVDAGVLATRLPDGLARFARDVLRHVGWLRREAA